MVIQHNLMALNASRQFGINAISRAKTAEKLGSGYRVNRSADNAAGLAISEKMRRQIRGLTQASRNAQDGISMVQTAEGALNEAHDMLQRMNELCIQAANDTMTYEDRAYIQMEIRHTMDEINCFGETVTFNGMKLFDGLLQTKCTAVAGGVSINGSSGSVTQATDTKNAFCQMNPLAVGDNVELSGSGVSTSYYKVATRDEILAYRQEWADYYDRKAKYDRGEITDEPTEPTLRDGSSSDKSELIEIEDLLPKIAKNLGQYNAGANADVAQSVTTRYSYANNGRFELRFNGPFPVKLQVGAEKGQYIEFEINAINTATLGLEGLNVRGDDNEGAEDGIDMIKGALSYVSRERSKLGSVQNRLEHTIRNLDNVVENTTQAESQIRDTDMAREMVSYSIRNILMQAGYTVMSQANASNSAVLSLVG